MRVNLGKTKLMVSGMDEETLDSKIDPCGVCGTKVMSNAVLCTAIGVDFLLIKQIPRGRNVFAKLG